MSDTANNVRNLIPLATFLEGLEDAARDVCHLVVLNPDEEICPTTTVDTGALKFKNWQIVAHRMWMAHCRKFGQQTRSEMISAGMKSLFPDELKNNHPAPNEAEAI